VPRHEGGCGLAHQALDVVDNVIRIQVERHRRILVPHEPGDLGHGEPPGQELGGHEVPERVERMGESEASRQAREPMPWPVRVPGSIATASPIREDPASVTAEGPDLVEEALADEEAPLSAGLRRLQLGGTVDALAHRPADVQATGIEVDVLPSQRARLAPTGAEGRAHVDEQAPQRVLLLGGQDHLLDLLGRGDRPLGGAGAACLHHVARVPADLAMRHGVLERLAEDGVQAARAGGRQRAVEGPEIARVPGQVLREEAADPPDVAADPALVVAPGPRGEVAAMTPVPVVYDLAHGESTGGPMIVVGPPNSPDPLEELGGRHLRIERSPISFAFHPPGDSVPTTVAFDPCWGCNRHAPLPRPGGGGRHQSTIGL